MLKAIFSSFISICLLTACTREDQVPPTPKADNDERPLSGSSQANPTTNATAQPGLETNTSTNFIDASSYESEVAKKGKYPSQGVSSDVSRSAPSEDN